MSKADRDQDRPASLAKAEVASGSDPHAAASGQAERDEADAPSADIQRYIGAQLRAVYDDVASQPIPDRFLDLMKRLG